MNGSHDSPLGMDTISTRYHMDKIPQGICHHKLLTARCETNHESLAHDEICTNEFIPIDSIDKNSLLFLVIAGTKINVTGFLCKTMMPIKPYICTWWFNLIIISLHLFTLSLLISLVFLLSSVLLLLLFLHQQNVIIPTITICCSAALMCQLWVN